MMDLQAEQQIIETQLHTLLHQQKQADESMLAAFHAVEHHVREARGLLYRIEREKLNSGLAARYDHLLGVLAEIDGKIAAQQKIIEQQKQPPGTRANLEEAVAGRSAGRARKRSSEE